MSNTEMKTNANDTKTESSTDNPLKRKLNSLEKNTEASKKPKENTDETNCLGDEEKGVSKHDIQLGNDSSTVHKDQKSESPEYDTSQLETTTEVIYKRPEELSDAERSVTEQDSQAADNGLAVKEDQESSSPEDDINQSKTAFKVIYKRPEAKTLPKLYRLLRDNEDISCGLSAKDPQSELSVAEHVAEGSKGSSSNYISTCSELRYAKSLQNLKSKRRSCWYHGKSLQIVEIDVDELPLDITIIDLTKREVREQYQLPGQANINRKFYRYAIRYGEVLLEGATVPQSCLENRPE